MKGDFPNPNHTADKNDDIDSDAYLIMKKLGHVLPTTEAELRELDKALEKNPISLSLELSDPDLLLNREEDKGTSSIREMERRSQPGIESNLAQAAREGKEITDSVKAKMRKDKELSVRKNS